jgi:hypothetical protein
VIVVAAFESPAVIAGLDDVTVMGQPVEQRGRHFESGCGEAQLPIPTFADDGHLSRDWRLDQACRIKKNRK